MEIIEQTNRTILFDEINPEKLDILTIIGDVKGLESLDDDKIKEINEKLLVKSFDEFLDKFSPTVYSFFNAANQKVMYTLSKPIFTMLAQLKISIVITVGRMHGISTCQIL